MSPEALEAIFVQREKLLARLIELVTQDSNSSGKHHSLMVGARGIGKTFLMSILYHRISVMPELKTKTVIAWLKEEEWGVTSYAEFIISILKAMDSEKDAAFDEEMDSLYNLDPNTAEKKAEELLEKKAGDRMVLLLAENMDMIFEDIKLEGQRKLRAFLQETSSISIIATSQSLFDGVSRQTSPFYGSFHIHHLESLTLDESLALLEKIARFRHDERLAEYIKTRAARARIRAVIHLSGGNHRVMAIFSQFLTYDTLEDLVSPFMSMIDELTPYYQSKMKELPAQQRKIVDYLCGKRGAAQVKEIARKSFMSHQASSSQLKILREKGYVVSKAIGRDSYYELAEPLMRLCVEVKMHKAEPVRLLIDMLRIWYSTEDLEKRIDFLKGYGLASIGKWQDSIKIIEKSLSQMLLVTDEIIIPQCNIASPLFDHFNHIQWQDKAMELVALFKSYKELHQLSSNVLNTLEKILSPIISLPMANEWLTAWEKSAGSDAEFTITLNIMRTALKYKENPGDKRVFMELPAEERIILKQLIEKAGINSNRKSETKGGTE